MDFRGALGRVDGAPWVFLQEDPPGISIGGEILLEFVPHLLDWGGDDLAHGAVM